MRPTSESCCRSRGGRGFTPDPVASRADLVCHCFLSSAVGHCTPRPQGLKGSGGRSFAFARLRRPTTALKSPDGLFSFSGTQSGRAGVLARHSFHHTPNSPSQRRAPGLRQISQRDAFSAKHHSIIRSSAPNLDRHDARQVEVLTQDRSGGGWIKLQDIS